MKSLKLCTEGIISIPQPGHSLCGRMALGTMLLPAAPMGWKVPRLPLKVLGKLLNLTKLGRSKEAWLCFCRGRCHQSMVTLPWCPGSRPGCAASPPAHHAAMVPPAFCSEVPVRAALEALPKQLKQVQDSSQGASEN